MVAGGIRTSYPSTPQRLVRRGPPVPGPSSHAVVMAMQKIQARLSLLCKRVKKPEHGC